MRKYSSASLEMFLFAFLVSGIISCRSAVDTQSPKVIEEDTASVDRGPFSEIEWRSFLATADRTPLSRATRDSTGTVTTQISPPTEAELRYRFLQQQLKAVFRARGAFKITIAELPQPDAQALEEFHQLNLKINDPSNLVPHTPLSSAATVTVDRDGTNSDNVEVEDGLNAMSF